MKILAFLQNQWFKNPAAVKAMFDRYPDKRNELIKRFLFSGCVSGQRLRETFGSDLCNSIIWEEASKNIASYSSGKFSADLDHIRSAVQEYSPALIICFGKLAGDAVKSLNLSTPVYYAPHPAARGNTIQALRDIAIALKQRINHNA